MYACMSVSVCLCVCKCVCVCVCAFTCAHAAWSHMILDLPHVNTNLQYPSKLPVTWQQSFVILTLTRKTLSHRPQCYTQYILVYKCCICIHHVIDINTHLQIIGVTKIHTLHKEFLYHTYFMTCLLMYVKMEGFIKLIHCVSLQSV